MTKLNLLLFKFASYRFFSDLIFIYPVYSLFFADNGISVAQISYLLIIWSLTQVIFEVPTGIIADKYNRRNIIVGAELIRGIGYSLWFIADGSFYMYALGFVMGGIRGAFISGTFSALVYDELKALKEEKNFEKIYGKVKMAGFVGLVIALTLGAYLAEYSYKLIFIFSIIVAFCCGLILLTLKPVPAVKSTEEKNYLRFLKKALLEALHNKQLFWLIAIYSFALAAFGAAEEFFALLLQSKGFSESSIGIFYGMTFILFGLAGYFAHQILPGNKRALFILLSLATVSFLLSLLVPTNLLFSAWIVAGAFFLGVSEIKFESSINHAISSPKRSTILSINGFVLETITIFFTFIVGRLASSNDLTVAIYLLLCILILASLSALFKLKPSRNNEHSF